jgi:hypothetical protein
VATERPVFDRDRQNNSVLAASTNVVVVGRSFVFHFTRFSIEPPDGRLAIVVGKPTSFVIGSTFVTAYDVVLNDKLDPLGVFERSLYGDCLTMYIIVRRDTSKDAMSLLLPISVRKVIQNSVKFEYVLIDSWLQSTLLPSNSHRFGYHAGFAKVR